MEKTFSLIPICNKVSPLFWVQNYNMDVRSYSKILLILVFIFGLNPLFLTRLIDIGFQVGALAFLFIWMASILSIVIIAFQPPSVSKYVVSIILVASGVMSASYYSVTQQYMEIYQFEAMLNATENLLDALSAFSGLIGYFFIGVIGLIGLLLPCKLHVKRSKTLILVPSILIILLIVIIVMKREGEGSKGMPSQYTVPSYVLILATEAVLERGPVTPPVVNIEPYDQRDSGDIIFVMDESMRGDFFDFNSKSGVPTDVAQYSPINFGVASSVANCSDPSNVSIRFGVSRDSYLADLKQKPSIWQFAKKAGFNTVYVDGQHSVGSFGNHMTKLEASFIDDFLQISDANVALYNKDAQAAKIIRGKLNNGVKDFIYVNKIGAHFPFEGKYPPEKRIYSPVMPPSGFLRSFHEADEVQYPISGDELTRLKFVNSYKNTLGWNFKSFFNTLFNDPITQPYTIIYTSDHGQTFHDDGRKGYGTHCSFITTDPEEGRVPLLLFSNIETVKSKMNKAASLNFNKVSHFNLPATVYSLMGYSEEDLHNYESSLYQPLNREGQQFLSKYYVRFGAKPIWNSIYSADTRIVINK
jgi:glucan phosphoethanolaminetransferase (alkaline phosphatase superfamily)